MAFLLCAARGIVILQDIGGGKGVCNHQEMVECILASDPLPVCCHSPVSEHSVDPGFYNIWTLACSAEHAGPTYIVLTKA